MRRRAIILILIFVAILAYSSLAIATEKAGGQTKTVIQFSLIDGQDVKGWTDKSIVVADTDSVGLYEQIEIVLQSLRKKGYPLCQVADIKTQLKDANINYLIEIDAGMPFIGRMKPSEVDTEAGDGANEFLVTEESLFQTVKSALDSLTDSGFPFARVELVPQKITLTDQLRGEIILRQYTGDFMRINAVRFSHLVRTKSFYLQNESRIQRGDVFSRTYLERSIDHLSRLNFIRSVESVKLAEVAPGLIDVLIDVDERSKNSFSVIAALDPQTQEMLGELDVRFSNLFGSGRELKTLWSNLVAERRNFELSYSEPWLFGYPFKLGLSLVQMADEASATNSTVGALLEWQPTFRWKGTANVARETYHPAEDTTGNAFKTWWVGGEFTWDDRDADWNPSRGTFLKTSHEIGYRKLSNFDSRVVRDRIEMSKISEFRAPVYVKISGRVEDVQGSALHRDDLATVGGAGSVRGYAENRYEVEGATTLSAEIIDRFGRTGYAGVFADTGWLYREATVHYADEWLWAYGATMAFNTRAGVLGLDIGWNRRAQFGEGRIHVRFTARF